MQKYHVEIDNYHSFPYIYFRVKYFITRCGLGRNIVIIFIIYINFYLEDDFHEFFLHTYLEENKYLPLEGWKVATQSDLLSAVFANRRTLGLLNAITLNSRATSVSWGRRSFLYANARARVMM